MQCLVSNCINIWIHLNMITGWDITCFLALFSLLPVFFCSSSLTGWSLDTQVNTITLAYLTFLPVLEVRNNNSYFHTWVNRFELFAVLFWCFTSSCGAFLSQCLSIRMSSWLIPYLKILFFCEASIKLRKDNIVNMLCVQHYSFLSDYWHN